MEPKSHDAHASTPVRTRAADGGAGLLSVVVVCGGGGARAGTDDMLGSGAYPANLEEAVFALPELELLGTRRQGLLFGGQLGLQPLYLCAQLLVDLALVLQRLGLLDQLPPRTH